MAREAVDRQSLLAFVTEITSKFPPQNDSDNAIPFRLISVDYLEGKVTYPQFNLLYTPGTTPEQITDGLFKAFVRHSRVPLNLEPVRQTAPEKWRLRQGRALR